MPGRVVPDHPIDIKLWLSGAADLSEMLWLAVYLPHRQRSSGGAHQGFAADPDYAKGEVFAYVGLPQNLNDLKDQGQGGPAFRATSAPALRLTSCLDPEP